MVFATKWHLMTYLLICLSQGGRASYREAGPLTERPCLSLAGRASHREAVPLTKRKAGLLQGGWASHREAGCLTGRPGL